MNPARSPLFPLLLVLLAGCSSAFEAGVPDAGAALDDGPVTVDSSDSGRDSGPDSGLDDAADSHAATEASPPTEASLLTDAATDTAVPDSSGQDVTEAAAPEAPECSAPRCLDTTTIQNCSGGSWSPPSSCPYVCLGNACAGTCVPGSAQQCSECSNLGEQTCSAQGQWGQCSAGC